MTRWRKSWQRLTLVWIGIVGIEVALVSALLIAGFSVRRELTGSMRPDVLPGDLVIARPVLWSKVQVGEVIEFHDPLDSRLVVMHEVVNILGRGPRIVELQTKGSANPVVDPWLLREPMTKSTAVVVLALNPLVALCLFGGPLAIGIVIASIGIADGRVRSRAQSHHDAELEGTSDVKVF